jgi:hypothetical protein
VTAEEKMPLGSNRKYKLQISPASQAGYLKLEESRKFTSINTIAYWYILYKLEQN